MKTLDSKNLLGKDHGYKKRTFVTKDGSMISISNRPSLYGIWYLEIMVMDAKDRFPIIHGVDFRTTSIVRVKKLIKYMIDCANKNVFGIEQRNVCRNIAVRK